MLTKIYNKIFDKGHASTKERGIQRLRALLHRVSFLNARLYHLLISL